MKLMVECPGVVREVWLRDTQIELYNTVKDAGSVTSAWVAEETGLSIANASAQLARLHRQKYLTRTGATSPSGGIEYTYSVLDL